MPKFEIPTPEEAINFLKKYRPQGPWYLSAFCPLNGYRETTTFGLSEIDKLEKWLIRKIGKENIYFNVNKISGPKNKKAKKENIYEIDALHIDLDPDDSMPFIEERKRLKEVIKSMNPKPNIIVDSGGGFQCYWQLEVPLSLSGGVPTIETIEGLTRTLEIKYGGDKCHNVDRIMRLPGTINLPNKKKLDKGRKAAPAILLEFNEDRRYSLDDFPKPMSVVKTKDVQDVNIKHTTGTASSIDELNSLCTKRTPQWLWKLITKGKSTKYPSRSEALFAVVCSLVRAGADDQTIINVITDPSHKISESVLDKRNNAFKYACRQIERARAIVSPPIIVQRGGELPRIVDASEQALIQSSIEVYQRGGMLVRIVITDKSEALDGVRRSAGSAILCEVKLTWLTETFSRIADWKRSNGNKTWPADPAEKYARHYLARTGDWKLPYLQGVINAPTLRLDGSVLQTEGYDARSQLYLETLGVIFPTIPDKPTETDAQEALELLKGLIAKFPFVNDAAKSAFLAAVLTSLIRPTLPAAPMFAFDAPTAGTGKSLLADLVSIIATGKPAAMMSQGRGPEDSEKRLSTVLAYGDPVIVIDNCERVLEGDFLCSMLTQERVQTRILGKSERIMLPSKSTIVATGNNLIMSHDVARRTIMCRIDSGKERPDTRQFEFDPRKHAMAEREQYVVAGLTIFRAYIVAGRPKPLKKIGSFNDWNMVREPLVWLGCADPSETRVLSRNEDPARALHLEILRVWHAVFGDRQVSMAEIQRECGPESASPDQKMLYQLLQDATPQNHFNSTSVGRSLRKYADQVVGGYKLCKQAGGNVIRWSVVKLYNDVVPSESDDTLF